LAPSSLCCKKALAFATNGTHGQDHRKYAGVAQLDEIKAEEYRYWQSRPAQERIDAVSELTQAMYALKGEAPDVPRL